MQRKPTATKDEPGLCVGLSTSYQSCRILPQQDCTPLRRGKRVLALRRSRRAAVHWICGSQSSLWIVAARTALSWLSSGFLRNDL